MRTKTENSRRYLLLFFLLKTSETLAISILCGTFTKEAYSSLIDNKQTIGQANRSTEDKSLGSSGVIH